MPVKGQMKVGEMPESPALPADNPRPPGQIPLRRRGLRGESLPEQRERPGQEGLGSSRKVALLWLQAKVKLTESEAKYQAMVEAFDGLIYISSGDYELEFLNQRFVARLGGNAVGQKCYRALHNLDQVCPWCARDRVLEGETIYRETLSPLDNRWYVCTSTPIRQAGRLAQMTIIQDITERKLAEELTRRLAYHDQLTGLPNRSLFNDRLTMALAQAQRHRQRLAVMLLDLDRFKDINDNLGHRVGDTLLKGMAQRLSGLLRKSDTVARLGGDEFILISAELARKKDAAKVARKILEACRAPFACEGLEVQVTASIGIAFYPDHGQDSDTLVKHADMAMYRAKKAGRNNYQIFPPETGNPRQTLADTPAAADAGFPLGRGGLAIR